MTVSGWFATRATLQNRNSWTFFGSAQSRAFVELNWLAGVRNTNICCCFFLEFRHTFFLSISGVHLSSTWKVNILPRANVQKQRKQYILGKYATYATILCNLRQSESVRHRIALCNVLIGKRRGRLFFKFNPDKKNHRWWLGGGDGGLRSCDNGDKQQNGCLLFANSVHDVLRKTGGYLPNIGSHTPQHRAPWMRQFIIGVARKQQPGRWRCHVWVLTTSLSGGA